MKNLKTLGLLALLAGCGGEEDTDRTLIVMGEDTGIEEPPEGDTTVGSESAKYGGYPCVLASIDKPNIVSVKMYDGKEGCVEIVDQSKLEGRSLRMSELEIYVDVGEEPRVRRKFRVPKRSQRIQLQKV